MYNTEVTTGTVIAGIIISILVVALSLLAITKMMRLYGTGQNIFVALAVFTLTVFLSIYMIDTLVAPRTELLTTIERQELVEMAKTFFLLVTGYYFRITQEKK